MPTFVRAFHFVVPLWFLIHALLWFVAVPLIVFSFTLLNKFLCFFTDLSACRKHTQGGVGCHAYQSTLFWYQLVLCVGFQDPLLAWESSFPEAASFSVAVLGGGSRKMTYFPVNLFVTNKQIKEKKRHLTNCWILGPFDPLFPHTTPGEDAC